MMTEDLAKRIAISFKGKSLGGFIVDDYHRHGGTSVVLRGHDNDGPVAIKVFDRSLINDADEPQAKAEIERIQRQLDLIRYPHDNIVKTRAAGQCPETEYHFLVMDFVEDPTIEDLLAEIPRTSIREIIRDIARGALYLQQTVRHVHRDIKPSNVSYNSKTSRAVLLDLGLVRPIEGDTVTDQAPRFVATKRYAPPEFLAGRMEKDAKGWETVTFYQLGGLLYSLIMRRLLFEGLNGDALIKAIENDVPSVEAADVPADLVQLARDCLQKSPAVRSSLVRWDRFLSEPDLDAASSEQDRLLSLVSRKSPAPAASDKFPDGAKERRRAEQALKTLQLGLESQIRSHLNANTALYPDYDVEVQQTSDAAFLVTAQVIYPQLSSDFRVSVSWKCSLDDIPSLLCTCQLVVARVLSSGLASPDGEEECMYRGSFVAGEFAEALQRSLPRRIADIMASGSTGPSEVGT